MPLASNFWRLYSLETIFFLWKSLKAGLPLYLDIHFLGGSGGVSPRWSSSGSFSCSVSEEGSLELLEDMWASKTFTFGEGEVGFSTSCFECLGFVGGMVFAGSLVLTQFFLCQLKCFSKYSKKGLIMLG